MSAPGRCDARILTNSSVFRHVSLGVAKGFQVKCWIGTVWRLEPRRRKIGYLGSRLICAILCFASSFANPSPAFAQQIVLQGQVADPKGNALPRAEVSLTDTLGKTIQKTSTGSDGRFSLRGILPGKYFLTVASPGFEPATRTLSIGDSIPAPINIQLKIARNRQSVTVTTDVTQTTVLAPDPAQRVLIRDETLDANPGRPGAPISIPGLPIETASGGIKAPQYFAPGVAGDHGEPIAQYIRVGTFLLPNNLSANAHGNGYADPNILVASALESVEVDG